MGLKNNENIEIKMVLIEIMINFFVKFSIFFVFLYYKLVDLLLICFFILLISEFKDICVDIWVNVLVFV